MQQEKQFPGEILVKIKDSSGNPAPLALLGAGMATILLNMSNAGLYSLNTMILGMGICCGGIAQLIAGIQEWKKGNTFGAVAFTSYGLFWFSLVALLMLPGTITEPKAFSAYFFMWGLFTLVLFIGTLRLNRALQVVFGSLTILFFLLCIKEANGSTILGKIAGYEGIISGLSAIYAGLAEVLNEVYGKVVLSIGSLVIKADKK